MLYYGKMTVKGFFMKKEDVRKQAIGLLAIVSCISLFAAGNLSVVFPKDEFVIDAPDTQQRVRVFGLDSSEIRMTRVRFSAVLNGKVSPPAQRWQGTKFMISYYGEGKDNYPGLLLCNELTYDNELKTKEIDFPADVERAAFTLGINSSIGKVGFKNLKAEIIARFADLSGAANKEIGDAVRIKGQKTFSDVPFYLPSKGNVIVALGRGESAKIPGRANLSGRKLYLLHRFGGGEVTVKLRGKAPFTASIAPGTRFGSAWREGDLDHEKPAYVYVSEVDLGKEGGTVESITLTAAKNWEVFGITLSDEAIAAGEAPIDIVEGKGWRKPAVTTPQTIIPGSVLDLSDSIMAEKAEKVVLKDGRFVKASSGEQMRFFSDTHVMFRRVTGFWDHPPEWTSELAVRNFVKDMKRRGFNMFRLHYTDASLMGGAKEDYKPREDMLEALFRLVKWMNKYGVYMNLDVMAGNKGWYAGNAWVPVKPDEKGTGKLRIYFDKEARENWRRGCQMLFNLKNPLTGNLLKDEPCMLLAVAYNEQEFGFTMGGPDYHRYASFYRRWLSSRYGNDIGKLNSKRKKSYASFEEVPMPTGDIWWSGDSVEFDDFLAFIDYMQHDLYLQYDGWFKEYAPGMYLSNWNMAQDLRQMSRRKDCDYVSMNGYYAHPFGRRFKNQCGDYLEENSSIFENGKLSRQFAVCRLQGKPFVITEYSFGYWHRQRYEMGFLMGGYAALQDWDAITPFGENVSITQHPLQIRFCEHASDPVLSAGNIVTALAYMRGDVKKSDLKIRYKLNRDELMASRNSTQGIAGWQSDMALVGSVALAVDEEPEKGAWSFNTLPGNPIIFKSEGFQTVSSEKVPGEMMVRGDDAIKMMKKEGRLSNANRSIPSQGIFESSTGELLLKAKEEFMQINTPRLQGVCSKGGATGDLKDVEILAQSERGNIVVASRDKLKPIVEAKRLLVCYITDAQNSGIKFANAKGSRVVSLGDPKTNVVLLKTGNFEVKIHNKNAAKMKAWAVAANGERYLKFGEKNVKVDGEYITLSVDTDKMQYGPTFYFELNVE